MLIQERIQQQIPETDEFSIKTNKLRYILNNLRDEIEQTDMDMIVKRDSQEKQKSELK